MFCIYFDRISIPASQDTILMFTQFLSRSFTSPLSIKNYLNGVKFLHVILGHEFSFSSDLDFRLLFNGIQRQLNHVPKRACPITPVHLHLLAEAAASGSLLDQVCFSAGLLLFFVMARAGNVFHDRLDPSNGLRRKDLLFSDDKLFVKFRKTKTIQFGKRKLIIPISGNGSNICPVSACARMIRRIPGNPTDPLFFSYRHKRVSPVTKDVFLSHIRKLLQSAGVDNFGDFTCHSFRRGGASWFFRVGVPGELIQVFGDWASDAYKLYLDISMDTKLHFADYVASVINIK